MYLVAVALCAALSLVDISGAQSCVSRDGKVDLNCGHCTVRGDPHIYTYDSHTLTNGNNPITHYEVPGGFDAKYAISQLGKDNIPLFGVSAHFKQCNNGKTCVSTVYYNEPGLEVELILPVKASTVLSYNPQVLYCQQNDRYGHGAPPSPNDPDCATKIRVNNVTRVFGHGGVVRSFPMVFKVGDCNSYKCQIFVVGSKGISVSLLVDPYLSGPAMYHLTVYSAPRSLRGPNTLFGLCDTFTGTPGTNHYTPRYGSPVCYWSKASRTQFIETWKINSGRIQQRQPALPQQQGCFSGFGFSVNRPQGGYPGHVFPGQVFPGQDFGQQQVIPTGNINFGGRQ